MVQYDAPSTIAELHVGDLFLIQTVGSYQCVFCICAVLTLIGFTRMIAGNKEEEFQ